MIIFGEKKLFELILRKWEAAGSPKAFFILRFDKVTKEEKLLLLDLRDIWIKKRLRRECSEFLLINEFTADNVRMIVYQPTFGFIMDDGFLPSAVRLKYVKWQTE